MFGLSEAHYNAVKRKCRESSDEIKKALAGGQKYDQVATDIIAKHYEQVKTIVTKMQFIWLSGYLNGRWGKQGEYE